MTERERLVFKFLKSVGLLLTLAFGAWWFLPGHIANNFAGPAHILDFILFLLVSCIVWHEIMTQLLFWNIADKIRKPFHYAPQPGLKVAFITTFVPGSEPIALLHRILPAMTSADYPHDTWLLDEGNDPEAQAVCQQYGVNYFSRKNIEKYNTADGTFAIKTKGGNHNAWYDAHGYEYDIVAQIDTDFIPAPNFLTATLGYFRNPRVAWVGTPQVYGNINESLVARGAAQQNYSFYGPILRGLHGMDMTLMIGANHVVRVEALKDIGLYNAHLTEDLLTSMHLHSKHWISMYVPRALAVGEGPPTWTAYFNQQMRWAFGCIDIFFRHTPKLIKSMKRRHARHYFLMEQHYFTGLWTGVGLLLLSLYAAFGTPTTDMGLNQFLLLYVPLLCWQLLVTAWLQRFYVDPEREKGPLWAGRLVSIAAWPIYLMAFIGVLRGKRLVFKVTPKGDNQEAQTPLSIFAPHIVIGTIALIDVILALLLHNTAVIMLFWMIVTAVTMYGLVLSVALPRIIKKLRLLHTIFRRPVSTEAIAQG
jgi:cellulose synthase (UDP-forming)